MRRTLSSFSRASSSATVAALLALAVTACAETGDDADADLDAAATDTAAARTDSLSVTDIGLETPESVLHEPDTDVYLVSNINGSPTDRDDNGFISKLTPQGRVVELKWIDGASPDVSLSAPKGMIISGGRLLVTDIDTVRAFDLDSGEPVAAWGIENASFLNDLAGGPDGAVYLSDTGVRIGEGGFESTGTAAVYRLGAGGSATALARGDSLMEPNGVAAGDGGALLVASFTGNALLSVDQDGAITTVATLPGGQLDGLVRTRAGDYLVSSWEAQAVFRVDSAGNATVIVEGVEAPADIGYDAQRNRVLIPLFMGNAVEIRPLR